MKQLLYSKIWIDPFRLTPFLSVQLFPICTGLQILFKQRIVPFRYTPFPGVHLFPIPVTIPPYTGNIVPLRCKPLPGVPFNIQAITPQYIVYTLPKCTLIPYTGKSFFEVCTHPVVHLFPWQETIPLFKGNTVVTFRSRFWICHIHSVKVLQYMVFRTALSPPPPPNPCMECMHSRWEGGGVWTRSNVVI